MAKVRVFVGVEEVALGMETLLLEFENIDGSILTRTPSYTTTKTLCHSGTSSCEDGAIDVPQILTKQKQCLHHIDIAVA